ncbi:hypothetical protein K469DRAFT_580805 [Zopfia rhizophila CBS 207.26]|uniref:MARVEL domain-containing protein n=1 Tax=Zopfia rhizophila CBS 207.26 TaxID=1314779 RepID=A0A6A6E0Q0_9PEZI|nr:hypothetical protein K469DRAFT_580805 [Zopfia rhizophila CBS 207.26]
MFQFRRHTMKSEKSSSGGFLKDFTIGSMLRIFARLLQFVIALTIAGLYGQDLHNAAKADKYADPKWVYAVVCAGMGAIWAVVCLLPLVKAWFFFGVDTLLWILHLALFGTFGKMYIKEDPEGNKGIQRMKNAVWVILTAMLLWFMTAVYGGIIFWKHRKARTLLTGRGEVHV